MGKFAYRNTRLTICMTEDEHKLLELLASEHHRSLSGMIGQLIREAVAKMGAGKK